MESFLRQIETLGLSVWIRESDSLLAFPGILILHTLGMAFFAGATVAVALVLLGAARRIRPDALVMLFPAAWAGLAVNAVSGVLLVIAYPTKALTNPVFYLKLAFIVLLVGALRIAKRQLLTASPSTDFALPANGKIVAVAMLLLAMLTIVGGRLLPYTYRHMMASY